MSDTASVLHGRESNTAQVNTNSHSLLSLNLDWLACAIPERLPDHITEYVVLMAADLSRLVPAIETHLTYREEPLYLSRTARGELVLKNDYLRLCFATEEDLQLGLAPATVTLYSICFWSCTIAQAFAELQVWCDALYGFHLLPLRPSRVDVAADLLGAPMPSVSEYPEWEMSFVRRSKVHRPICKAGAVETVYLGSPKAPLKMRVYNKSLEMQKHGKDYYKPMWSQNGYVEGDTVTRYEWQCGSSFLREWLGEDGSRVETLADLLRMLPGIYKYLCGAAPAFGKTDTKGWIRHTVPSDTDSHRQRWQVSPLWKVVQSATFSDLLAAPIEVSRQAEKHVKLERLKPQLIGVFKSVVSLIPGGRFCDREELAQGFYRLICEYEQKAGESIEAAIERRYCELHSAA